jgi:arginine deiminase
MRNNININSEIGKLKGVILHQPGPEVENMTPESAEKSLYSDLLNLSIASEEYSQLKGTLTKVTKTFEVNELLATVLKDEKVKERLVKKICYNENATDIIQELMDLNHKNLARFLIEGYLMRKDNLTKFLNNERYSLLPLPNFFFTRDASIAVGNHIFIGQMASKVRDRESLIMEAIFDHHSDLYTKTINAKDFNSHTPEISFEGGDILIAREDILLIGSGSRTSTQGIDFIIDQLKQKDKNMHILVQELPHSPESFIHLDMVFTMLDTDQCMIYEPLILGNNRYRTVRIDIVNGTVNNIEIKDNLLIALKELGMDVNPVICGGSDNIVNQEREQWHSGANFFALAPGKLIGYSRNIHTAAELNKYGYEIIPAQEFIKSTASIDDYKKLLITIDGSELSRGGGGARCMTMPVRRSNL